MAATLIPDWLRQQARVRPTAVALECGEQRLTFQQFDTRIDVTVEWLRAQGVTPGAHVALLASNSVEFVQTVFACLRLGAVLVPLNTRLTPAEIAWQLEDAAADLLLFDSSTREAVVALAANGWDADDQAPSVGAGLVPARSRRTPRHVQPPARSAAVDKPPPYTGSSPEPAGAMRDPVLIDAPVADRLDLERPACIVYTSGTTGFPKGAVLTVGNLWWSAVGSALNLGLLPDDAWLACLPLFHVGGLSILIKGAIYGMRVVVQPRFDPEAVNAAVDQQGVTIVSVVAAMLQRMLDQRGEAPYPAWLRCLLLGGGPAPRDLLERGAALGAPVVQTYGLTESASQVVTLAPADALRKLGSAGQPLLPNEVRILAEHGPAATGQPGEIVVRGPTVMAAYYNRPDATTEKLRDGWLHTGDLGYLDADGYLYVLDRRDDLIISGGENVYPAEIEAALRQHPDVLDAGVRGEADPRWGQVPVAWVVARPDTALDAEQLSAYLRDCLAAYKQPRTFHLVPELPRNAAGKLLRRELRAPSRKERSADSYNPPSG